MGLTAGTAVNLERNGRGLLLHAGTTTRRAQLLDRLAAATAGVTADLHLLEHAWGELLLDDAHAVTATGAAVVDLLIGAAGALASFANMLAVPLELSGGAVIKVAERDLNLDLDVVTAGLVRRVSEVAVAAKESAEHIKGVMAAPTASVAAVLDALVSVSVVNLSAFGVAQDIVRL